MGSNKYKKDRNELKRQFANGVLYLKELIKQAMAKDYNDPLREEYAKSIAVKLRVLLINGNTESLISQLKISDKILFPPICVFLNDIPGNLIQTFGLVGERFDGEKAYYFSNYVKNDSELRCTLSCWLSEIVFDRKQSAIHKVSRRDIILYLANKEGGAHVDPEYEEEYYHIIYESGFFIQKPDGTITRSQNNCFAEAAITIALEFIEAAEEYFNVLNGAIFARCYNDLSFVELLYNENNENGFRKKYMHNQRRDIHGCFMVSYDYLGVARYRLIFSKNYVFYKNNNEYFLRVIDDSDFYEVLFCICGLETIVFIKEKDKYYKIEKEDDLYSIEKAKHFTFSQAIRLIKAKEKANLDCLNKQQQYLDNIK